MVDVKNQWYGNVQLACYVSRTEPGPYAADVRVRRIESVEASVIIIASLESWYGKLDMMDFFDHLVETNWLPAMLIMGGADREINDAALERALAEWRQMEEDRRVRNPADVSQ